MNRKILLIQLEDLLNREPPEPARIPPRPRQAQRIPEPEIRVERNRENNVNFADNCFVVRVIEFNHPAAAEEFADMLLRNDPAVKLIQFESTTVYECAPSPIIKKNWNQNGELTIRNDG